MKLKLKGNILAFLTHFSVTFALRTCGRKLANEPKSDRNITDLVSAEQYTRRTDFYFDSFDACKQKKRGFK